MPEPVSPNRKAVIVISSHVVRGTVGNRAIVFALERLGHPVWAVPTIVLPWHPGHGPATRIVPDADKFASMMDDLASAPWLEEVGAIITGYLGDAEQAGAAARLITAVRARNPEALYLCDPVIGDAGGLYVPAATAEAIRDRLVPLADIATPNQFELQWLTGIETASRDGMVQAAGALPPATVVVTSAPGTTPEHIGNLLVAEGRATLFEHERHARPPHGAGDLTSALVAAGMLEGRRTEEAVERATRRVYSVLRAAIARGGDELSLAADAALLETPDAYVDVRVIEAPGDVVIAGVDGCKAGWVAVVGATPAAARVEILPTFGELIGSLPPDAIIAVDMPIGLPNQISKGGRGPERLVRPLLGGRQTSVFSIPSRAAVYAERGPLANADDLRDAHSRASDIARQTSDPPKSISIQAFCLFPKIREIDMHLIERPELRSRVIESHPELAFWRLNGEQAMTLPKKIKGKVNPPGMDERKALLASHGIPRALLDAKAPKGAGADDVLDAAAMFLIAQRHAQGLARAFPDPPLGDAHGIPIAIWA